MTERRQSTAMIGGAPAPAVTAGPVEDGGEDTVELPVLGALPISGREELLDGLAGWPPAVTPAGSFRLMPVLLPDHLERLVGWMNDPAVARFWELAGPPERTRTHVQAQLDGDGRSAPCLGLLDGAPMSYWEIYRADLDRIATYVPARPHDTGIHLLLGSPAHRGRGLGSTLLRAVSDLILARRPKCARILAEPDVRNTASLRAFQRAGFHAAGDIELPEKTATLMIRER